MYSTSDQFLYNGGHITGDGSVHTTPWVPVSEFIEGLLFVSVSAISGGSLQVGVDVASDPNASNLAPGASALVVSNFATLAAISGVSTVKAQLTNFGKWMRLNYSLTAAQTATFVAVFQGKRLG